MSKGRKVFTPMQRRQDYCRGRRVGRGRLGGILRVHPHPPLEVFNILLHLRETFFQHFDTLFQRGVLRRQLLYIRVFVHAKVIDIDALLHKNG